MDKLTAQERYWMRVEKSTGCWIWQGAKTNSGYGVCYDGKRTVCAHRYGWELVNGPIPAGLEIDHMCFVRDCVNPSHLRLATRAMNTQNRRGASRNNRSSGVRGVYRGYKGWIGRVRVNGRNIHLGTYPTIEAAAEAVAREREKHSSTLPA